LSFLITISAYPDSIGIQVNSLQGLTKKQCNTLMHAFDGIQNPKISFLWGTFNRKFKDNFDCAVVFLERFKNVPSVLQIYGDNATCRRPPRICEAEEVKPQLRTAGIRTALERRDKSTLRAFKRRVGAIRNWVELHAGAKTQKSYVYSLEDDFSEKGFKNLRIYLEPEIPTSWLVGRNPNGTKQKHYNTDGLDFIELHGLLSNLNGNPFSFSNDGVDADFSNGYRPTGNFLPVSTMFSTLREIREFEGSIFTWFWWNNQGIERKFILPSLRNFIIRSHDVSIINKELKK